MYRLDLQRRIYILRCLTSSVSLRRTALLTESSLDAVIRFNCDFGRACEALTDRLFQNLTLSEFEADEIWTLIGGRESNSPTPNPEFGPSYLWLAVCPKSRLVPVWHAGTREERDARWFIHRLHQVLKPDGRKITIATDGYHAYSSAIESAFGDRACHVKFIKVLDGDEENEARRGAPQKLIASRRYVRDESIQDSDATTCHVESLNMTLRQGLKRFARETNALSKKAENHRLAISMWLTEYNFCRIHSSIRCTPAMEAGITDHIWSHEELIMKADAEFQDKEAA